MIQKIEYNQSRVEVGNIEESSFNELLNTRYANRKIVVIVDENTQEQCWPYVLTTFEALKEAEVMLLPVGEENKVMEVCFQVWEALTTYQIQRNDLIINIGGGVITDMGGFIASVFKRGMDFINIPTTLLGITDASVGGKTGINLGPYKNQLGCFSNAVLTICDARFLSTLSEREIISGKAEMLKHGLIASREHYQQVSEAKEAIPNEDLIAASIQVKATIVESDFTEETARKKLNFGHTVGHSLEGFLRSNEVDVTHGECIAWGMLTELYISQQINNFPADAIEKYVTLLKEWYPILPVEESHFSSLIELMKNDKKNNSEAINFTLLHHVGKAEVDYTVDEEYILKALQKTFL